MKKRILAFGMAAMMVIATGCGAKNTTDKSEGKNADSEVKATEKSASENEDDYDYLRTTILRTYDDLDIDELKEHGIELIKFNSDCADNSSNQMQVVYDKCKYIIRGKITGHEFVEPDASVMETYFDFKIDDVIKGDLNTNDIIKVCQTGGIKNTDTGIQIMFEEDNNNMVDDGEYIVFLSDINDDNVGIEMDYWQKDILIEDGKCSISKSNEIWSHMDYNLTDETSADELVEYLKSLGN